MKRFLILATLFFNVHLWAQDPITIHNGCNFKGEEAEEEYYTFDPSNEANRIVKQILDGAGSLSYNSFILKESNVQNALATSDGRFRYILYSTTFLEKFKGDAKTKWAAYTVLAHEIGHHLNGHNFAEKDPRVRKRMELEADKFAGAICRTLGATLDQALAGMEAMVLEGETATHPGKTARVAAIANGWKKQDEVLKGQPPAEIREMESAMETLTGKIYQKFMGVEAILLSAKREMKNITSSPEECVVFSFLVQNRTDSVVRYSLYIDANQVTRTSIVVDGSYDVAERIELENKSYTRDNYNQVIFVDVAEQASSNFKVYFSRIGPGGRIPELRVTIAVNGKKKTLSFKNIPLPYEIKR